MSDDRTRFRAMWDELEPIGRRSDGGYDRFAWSDADRKLRGWFRRTAAARGLAIEEDRNANLWAWWGHDPADGLPPARAVASGSHLDSVPRGGAYDGPLGIVSAFLALDELRSRYPVPDRPVAVVVFNEEEGARFGVACLGSRLSTGALDPARARSRVDTDGVALSDAMRAAGVDPDGLGADAARLMRLDAFVELHVEQGRLLADAGAPVGVATEIWPHGRWRLRFAGDANHAGTTRLEDRKDPMLPFAAAVASARTQAYTLGGLATVGRVLAEPNATNAVALSVDAWLDARAPCDAMLESIVDAVVRDANAAAASHGVALSIEEESRTAAVAFDAPLRTRVVQVLGGSVPEMSTGAGHDAGVLAASVPTAMLFVRNPTGVSHSPSESATDEDCLEGIRALTCVLEALTWD